MAELFQRDRSVLGKHIKNIFDDGELRKESVWAKFAHTAEDGKVYQVDYYNLDVIISVGYKVKSLRGTQFRIWANSVLKEYLLKHITEWVKTVRKYEDINELNREILLKLVEQISVFDADNYLKSRISIMYKYNAF